MVWQQENRLSYEDFLERHKNILYFFVFLFFLLVLKLFHLQIIKGKYYYRLSEQQRTHVIIERAPRGIIYDKDNKIIVGNKTAFVALFYPFSQEAIPKKDVLDKLKSILDEENVTALITQGLRSGRVVRLADNLSRLQMFLLQEQRMIFPGISVVKEERRNCLYPDANSHLVGYVNEITKKELSQLSSEGYKMGDWVGRSGLEKYYDSTLRGTDGGWQIEVDAYGRQTQIVNHIQPSIGNNIHTTIDMNLQRVAFEMLQKSPSGKGAVVGIDPRSGAVRVLVSCPGFNPNISFMPEFSDYLSDNENLPLFNRAVQALYSPGSVFKVVTYISALAEDIIKPDQKYKCRVNFHFGNKTFQCWEKKGHGRLDLVEALAKSCNVYFYQLGLKVGVEHIERYAKKFQLGKISGLELYSEEEGLVPNVEWKKKKLGEPWHPGDSINMAIGQGYLWITPIQIAQMVSIIANRGLVYKPYVVDRIVNQDELILEVNHPEKIGEIYLKDDVWQLTHEAMKLVVQRGTGQMCKFKDLEVAGKTGTAQNPHGEDHAWFIGFAPVVNPELALAVLVENGGSGGGVAAPIARSIFKKAFDAEIDYNFIKN